MSWIIVSNGKTYEQPYYLHCDLWPGEVLYLKWETVSSEMNVQACSLLEEIGCGKIGPEVKYFSIFEAYVV
jgi:hypothetical protein